MGEKNEKFDIKIETHTIHANYIKEEYETNDHFNDKVVCAWGTIINTKDNKTEGCIKGHKVNVIEMPIADNIKTEQSSPEMCTIMINDSVKIEDEIGTAGVLKVECNNKYLFCNNCQEYYRDYCTQCGMLVYILNRNTFGNSADERAQQELPVDILEIRFSSGQFRVFALKTVPNGVRLGPFTGLTSSELFWKIKGGRLVNEDESMSLNWMQHINSARNSSEQNLLIFQVEGNVYYRSIREIQVGDELLVYFGEEYEDSRNRDTIMDFIAPTENDTRDVFACTYCCLGFYSREYLAKHKAICQDESPVRLSVEELTRCSLCYLYMGKMEYSEYHRSSCRKGNDRKCAPLVPTNKTVQVRIGRLQRRHTYKCTQCTYSTAYRGDLKIHANKHYEVKQYKCAICSRRFKMKGNLERHLEKIHSDVDGDETQKYSAKAKHPKAYHDPQDETKPSYKHSLKNHTETNHVKQFRYECEICEFRTNRKSTLKVHIRSLHLKEFNSECAKGDRIETHMQVKHVKGFSYRCESCEYCTRRKENLGRHIKTIHLKEYKYDCGSCEFRTNKKCDLERHIKTKHLQEFDHKCEMCDYKTNYRPNLENHIKSKHLKLFNCKCEMGDVKTNWKEHTEMHRKTKHLKEFSYKCELCAYNTNRKENLGRHIKTIHLKEYKHNCESCEFRTNKKCALERHIKTQHLKEFDHRCELCEYKSNNRMNLENHVKSKHLKEFNYECATCEYKTNNRVNLENHIKAVHWNKFNYNCATCAYKTNKKQDLENHIKSEHLNEFDYKCEMCEYETNRKGNLERHIRALHLQM